MKAPPIYRRAFSFYKDYGLIALLRKTAAKSIAVPLSTPTAKGLIARSKLLTTAYFYVQGTYYHEQKKVLNGQALHQIKETNREDPTHRRIQYTHILEKGLSVPDEKRRDTFGDYVVKTLVEDIAVACKQSDSLTGNEQLKWSVDVLAAYFDETGENPTISAAEDRFRELLDTIDYVPDGRVPQSRCELETSTISYEHLKTLADQRSSTRYFLDKEVPRDVLDKALRIAAKSPSACNRQSFEFRIYDEREQFEDLFDHRVGTGSYEDNIPVLVVLTGKQRAYKDDSERNTIFIDASLAAMSFQFALETLGLGACMINWPMHPTEQRTIADQLKLDSDEQVISFIAVGYPDPEGKIPYSSKKNLNEIRSYNRRN